MAGDDTVVVWAAPGDAAASVNAAAITTRFNIRTSASPTTHRSGPQRAPRPAHPITRAAPVFRLLADRVHRHRRRRRSHGRVDEPSAAATADLSALPAPVRRPFRRPFVRAASMLTRRP